MRKILTGAVLLAAAAATPAFAQEADAPFTGAHIEALGGYDNVEGDDGFAYGAGAGFDFQAGKAILGIEGEYMDSTTRERESGVFAAGDNLRLSSGRDIYVGAKVGFAVAPATMLYGKAGYTNARAKFRYDDGLGTVSTGGNNLDGYRLGVGVEQKFNLLGPSGSSNCAPVKPIVQCKTEAVRTSAGTGSSNCAPVKPIVQCKTEAVRTSAGTGSSTRSIRSGSPQDGFRR